MPRACASWISSAQLALGGSELPVRGKPLVDVEEVLLAIAMIVVAPVRARVLQHGREPDRLDAQQLQIAELRPHARERSALAEIEAAIPAPLGGCAGLLKRSSIRK